ncbi:MAG TPA: DUF5915 domain-containing protein, partial [Pedobacter sp.]
LFLDLDSITQKEQVESVHLSDFPMYHIDLVDTALEERMSIAQNISSMILSLRKKVGINVRQPLNKTLLPVLDSSFQDKVERVKELILSETNIKTIEYINDTSGIIKKKIKPNFKALGAKAGKQMKDVAAFITGLSADQLTDFERAGTIQYSKDDFQLDVSINDVEIIAEDVPGWQVTNMGKLTVALDVTVTNELKQEGISRELVNRIQNLRKELNFEVTDKINVRTSDHPYITEAVKNNLSYICAEILADSFELVNELKRGETVEIDEQQLLISITKA